jgi:tRNA1(Val) A37 N6-methylase TrmN6
LYKLASAGEIAQQRSKLAAAAESIKPSDRWHVHHTDMAQWQSDKQFDFIVTDPPYPKEFLPLYETLAHRANDWLKDGGLLVAMCGQSYLHEIYALLSKHLTYYWTAAYLTPGQPTRLRQVIVNTTRVPGASLARAYSRATPTTKIITNGGSQ